MSVALDSLLKVDWSQVSAMIQEGLQSGKMILSRSNGNVYWAAGSGRQGIVAQLPLIPVSPQELASAEQLLQVGNAVSGAKMAAVTAAGAAVVVVAVVVATTYLANKIEKVERLVNEVVLVVAQQDQREYLRYVSDYTGAVMAARKLLQSHAPQSEIASLAEHRIDKLVESRLQLLRFVRGLLHLVSSPENTTEAQYESSLRFVVEMLDFIPSAIAIERELCLISGKPFLAKDLSTSAASEFRQVLAEFRKWCDEQRRKLMLGKGGFVDVLVAYQRELEALFNSLAHDLLLGDRDAVFVGETASASTDPEIARSTMNGSNSQFRGS